MIIGMSLEAPWAVSRVGPVRDHGAVDDRAVAVMRIGSHWAGHALAHSDVGRQQLLDGQAAQRVHVVRGDGPSLPRRACRPRGVASGTGPWNDPALQDGVSKRPLARGHDQQTGRCSGAGRFAENGYVGRSPPKAEMCFAPSGAAAA